MERYQKPLLQLALPWKINRIELGRDGRRVDIYIDHAGESCHCPGCGSLAAKRGHGDRHTWWRRDTTGVATYLHCRLPLTECEAHGPVAMDPPWLEEGGRFAPLLEEPVLTCA